jgi:uncharacterized protein YyaL (SSP411 family)
VPNRLLHETSPYLQQHADNPVDWYPWGEEALARARVEDKPILLSVGYSACHWCHVMAHESFEDSQVAAVMNRLFVNIKVDREERPDIDQIYQRAHQLFSQRSGGWPLTMFLAPDQTPFFGGTYFPKSARYGLPGFVELLERAARFYAEQRSELAQQNEAVRNGLERMSEAATPVHHSEFSIAAVDAAVTQLKQSFDARRGGFGDAPKFPHTTDLALAMRRFAATGDRGALEVATVTLEKMAEGGIYDQLGGGFCRYSVDGEWSIPHFEKMLYDNGPLLALCGDAYVATSKPIFKRVVEETAAWLMREMQSPEGGYYSTLDADSEGHEGKFYVWRREEVEELLAPAEYAAIATHYGLDRPPNFEGEAWHLRICAPPGDPALLESARAKLFTARERRIRPGRDEKILTSWNALAIAGMAHVATLFERRDWLDSARRALEFVRGSLWRDGRLLATFKDGRAHLNAYVDDYAFLLAALLELMQADFHAEDLALAEDLAEVLLDQFEDKAEGGFYFTSHDHEQLIHRPKPGHDNATPSGNGVAAFALNRLGHLLGENRYLEAAERCMQAFYGALRDRPAGYSSLLAALEEMLVPPRIVILRGEPQALKPWRRALAARFLPDTLTLSVSVDAAQLPPALAKPSVAGEVNAYVCQGVSCLAPLRDLTALEDVLKPPEIG